MRCITYTLFPLISNLFNNLRGQNSSITNSVEHLKFSSIETGDELIFERYLAAYFQRARYISGIELSQI